MKMTDKFFYVLMALVSQGLVMFGWGNENGWMGNAALVMGGVFAGVLMAEVMNDGDMK
jgi:hypothetical protein